LAMLKRHPDSVERVVLASAEGLDQTVKLPARTDAFLKRLSAKIAAHPVAGKRFPDLFATMKRVFARVGRERPLVSFTGPGGKEMQVRIGPYDLQLATAYLIKNPETLPMLAEAFARLDDGDYGAAAPHVARLRSALRLNAMSIAMDDASGISPERRKKVERQRSTSLLSDALNFPFPALFGASGVPDLGPDFRSPVKTDVPALFLTGTLDGRTYPEGHREIMQGFSRPVHVVIEDAGHDLFMSTPGVHDVIAAFLEGRPVTRTRLAAPPVRWEASD
ncbi:MAG: alpha/beta hydrolase, partial [Alphaproteobacteria bacterium]